MFVIKEAETAYEIGDVMEMLVSAPMETHRPRTIRDVLEKRARGDLMVPECAISHIFIDEYEVMIKFAWLSETDEEEVISDRDGDIVTEIDHYLEDPDSGTPFSNVTHFLKVD